MSSNYLTYFNLKDDPFRITPDIAYFYNSPEHSTALLSLEYCIKGKEGFCILTGEPGTGKTTILRLFVEKWKDSAEIALIMTPRLSPEEFFMAILEDFKIPLKSSSKNDMLKAFRDFLLQHADNNKPVAIIIDEAQELPDTTLEELRLLSNLETEKEKLLQIILVGQPELRNKLLSQNLRQLNSRITVRIQLKSLNESETSDYINNRLFRAGSMSSLFNDKAKKLIFELSGGIPRTINLLASRGLMSAFLEGKKDILERHVEQGATDVMETQADKYVPSSKGYSYRTIILAAILLLCTVAGGIFFFLNPLQNNIGKITQVMPVLQNPAPTKLVTAQISSAGLQEKNIPIDSNKSAFDAFNEVVSTWDIAPFASYEKSASDPWTYLASLSGQIEMELTQYSGTLKGLLDVGYPAILQLNPENIGSKTYCALLKSSGEELVIACSTGEKKNITRKELENLWQGEAFILWKNFKGIPPQIPLGSRTNETASLHKLLRQSGLTTSKDKTFNQKTVDVIKTFQRDNGIRVTGQPDPQTLLRLYENSAAIFYHPSLR